MLLGLSSNLILSKFRFKFMDFPGYFWLELSSFQGVCVCAHGHAFMYRLVYNLWNCSLNPLHPRPYYVSSWENIAHYGLPGEYLRTKEIYFKERNAILAVWIWCMQKPNTLMVLGWKGLILNTSFHTLEKSLSSISLH